MQKMIAQSSMRYNTRRLVAGEEFEARPRDARVLAAVGKARPAAEPQVRYPAMPPHDEITLLRAEYQRRFGKRPFMGWDEAQLREKLAAS